MAQLNSPGVSVTVTNESFYTPAAPGTTPLIFVASAENKAAGSGTGIAQGTLKANAGKVYLLSSQKDLTDYFGVPSFKTDAKNNPIHAGEQNEYGLQAAYSYLGINNRAFVVRADVNLDQLTGSHVAPAGAPLDGSYWLDTSSTEFGLFVWNSDPVTVATGQKFSRVPLTVLTDPNDVVDFNGQDYTPVPSFGEVGEYTLVSVTTLKTLWYKDASATWIKVDPDYTAVDTSWLEENPIAVSTVAFSANIKTFTLTANSITATSSSPATIGELKTDLETVDILAAGVRVEIVNSSYLAIYSTQYDVQVSGEMATDLGFTIDKDYRVRELTISPHTSVPDYKRDGTSVNGTPTGSLWLKTTSPNQGANWVVKKYSSSLGAWNQVSAPLYESNQAAMAAMDPIGGLNIPAGTIYVKINDAEETPKQPNFKPYIRTAAGVTTLTTKPIIAGALTSGAKAFDIQATQPGTSVLSSVYSVSFSASGLAGDLDTVMNALVTALAGSVIIPTKNSTAKTITLTHKFGGDIIFTDTGNEIVSSLFVLGTTSNFYNRATGVAGEYIGTLWSEDFDMVFSDTAPTTAPEDGTLWYNSLVDEIDIMVHTGSAWSGYLNELPNTNPTGPIVSASKPTLQSDGTALVTGDLWIDTSDIENYPMIYRYNSVTRAWTLLDKADNTTEEGIIFYDARYSTNGGSATVEDPSTIVELLSSDFIDFDAPDPALYPKGMLLWNTRRSGFNVKAFRRDYVDLEATNEWMNEAMTDYYPHRWVSVAPRKIDGSGVFGRRSQRAVVVNAFNEAINSNQDLRDEEGKIFNLIACPGYVETLQAMRNLNIDRSQTAFIVGDTPPRLVASSSALYDWGTNANNAASDGEDGLVTFDEYVGVFYPWGYTTDNYGNDIVVPPSHMMLRTIALNDNVSYPWFAPAGVRRGVITNASAAGYIDPLTGEFIVAPLTTNIRDTMALVKINPITYLSGTGLVNYAEYTRAGTASAMDRINVARLVVYLRRQFAQLAKPFIYEPNDKITRDEFKGAADSLLLELVGQRALYDFVTVCDSTNNTPARIDRNEMYLDVAIEPTKTAEFIYIPLRLQNTGEIKTLISR